MKIDTMTSKNDERRDYYIASIEISELPYVN
jgi:hypothetical protein